jgi:hypothetical protein
MKALEVKIKEFKKLKNIEKELAGNHILVMGDNEVGKSSLIQFMEIALGKQRNVPPGAHGSGELTIDLKRNKVTFNVSFRDGKPYIKVKGNGISIDNNKSAIAQLVGANEFDIEEFVNLSKTKAGRKEQVERFKKFLPLETQQDLSKFEANLKNQVEERTELGRDIDKLKGAISQHPLNNLPDLELTKFVETDTVEVMNLLKATQEHNTNVTKIENGLAERKGKIADKNIQIAELQAQINKLNEEIKGIDVEVVKAQDWLKKNDSQPTDVFEKAIADATENNLKASQAKALLSEREKLLKYQDEYGHATVHIETSREAIANAIREMEGPIQGLAYDDEQLVYNGIPVNPDSLSKSQIMELGVRLKLAENPENIIFIQEAESLGTERFLMLKEIADKNNCQIIAEQVQRGEKELHIEIMTDELITA